MPRLTTLQVRTAAQRYALGVPAGLLARELGVSGSTIRHHLRTQGLDTSGGKSQTRDLPHTAIQDALALYRSGHPSGRWARRLLISYSATRTLLLRHGVLRTRAGAQPLPGTVAWSPRDRVE